MNRWVPGYPIAYISYKPIWWYDVALNMVCYPPSFSRKKGLLGNWWSRIWRYPISKRQSHVKNWKSGNCLVASASCKWMRLCIAISCQFCWFKPHVGLLNPGCLHKYLLYIFVYIYISYIHYINGLVEGKCSRKPWFAPNIWGLPADFPLNQLKSIECIYIYIYIIIYHT